MKNIIEKYINHIAIVPNFSMTTYEVEELYYFTGDGSGDFEESGYEATDEVVLNYIEDCKKQIKIAEDYLKLKEEK